MNEELNQAETANVQSNQVEENKADAKEHTMRRQEARAKLADTSVSDIVSLGTRGKTPEEVFGADTPESITTARLAKEECTRILQDIATIHGREGDISWATDYLQDTYILAKSQQEITLKDLLLIEAVAPTFRKLQGPTAQTRALDFVRAALKNGAGKMVKKYAATELKQLEVEDNEDRKKALQALDEAVTEEQQSL